MQKLPTDHGKSKGRRSTGWVRLHRDVLHNPKLVRLTAEQFRAWVQLLLMANDAGELPPVCDVACHMRVSDETAETLLKQLHACGLVDVDVSASAYAMHDWASHQYVSDSSTDRVRKFRSKNKDKDNVSETKMKRHETVSVTPPEAETEAETETEEEKKELRAVRTARRPSSTEEVDQQFEVFWRAFPGGRKRDKGRAKTLFRQIVRGGHHTLKGSAETLIAAAEAYAASKPDPQFTPMPTTWLTGGRWEDDLAESTRSTNGSTGTPLPWSEVFARTRELEAVEDAKDD